MTVALLTMLGAALLALVGLVERSQARFEGRLDRMSDRLDRLSDRLDAVAEGQARMEGQIATLDREVGQMLSHVLGREAPS
ncbi:MAG TPA: hypothetical protein VE575_12740 [Acidimicrobiales bacterium]|jgi:hypothetical protein|nr:hypothetical protein [Acidimicrobiales bacterium]